MRSAPASHDYFEDAQKVSMGKKKTGVKKVYKNSKREHKSTCWGISPQPSFSHLNTSVIFIWSALILCFSSVLFLFWRMILHRNGHGHGSGKSYHKNIISCFLRCLHWVDIQYLDTYFGSLFSFSGWLGITVFLRDFNKESSPCYLSPAQLFFFFFVYNDLGSSVFIWSLLFIMS